MPQLTLKPFPLSQPTRNQKPSCQICNEEFGLLTREHLCKRCYRFVCDKCAPHKVKMYKADMQHRMHRMCKICHTESEILSKYISNNKLVWGQDSDMSKLWLKQLGHRNINFRASVNPPKEKNNTERRRIKFQTTASELWASFNYSFRQFIGMTIDRNKTLQEILQPSGKKQKSKNLSIEMHNRIVQDLMTDLADVVTMINNPNIEVQSTLYILIFFMCHTSAINAKLFTKSIIQFLSFQEPSIDNMIYYLQSLKCTDIEIYKIQGFLQPQINMIISCATVNYFSTELTIQIISALISKKSYEELEKSIAYLVSKRKQFICKNASKPQLVVIDLLKNNQGLGEGYKKFIKSLQAQQFEGESPIKVGSMNKIQNESFKTDSSLTGHRDKKFYENLIKQNEELKIKNKNQQEQIVRLKAQNNRLVEKQQRMKADFENQDKWSKVRKRSMMIQQKEKQKIIQEQEIDLSYLQGLKEPKNIKQLYRNSQKEGIEMDEKESQKSYESYWQEVPENDDSDAFDDDINQPPLSKNQSENSLSVSIKTKRMIKQELPFEYKEMDNYDKVIRQLNKSFSRRKSMNKPKTKLVKKYRLKEDKIGRKNRMTTHSQKIIKDIQQFNKKYQKQQHNQTNNYMYQQIIFCKNEEILVLNQKLQEMKKKFEIYDGKSKNNSKNSNKNYYNSQENSDDDSSDEQMYSQNAKLKKQLKEVKEMNAQMLGKLKELSNILMDREDEAKEEKQSLQQLMAVYAQKQNINKNDCNIF